MQNQTAGNPSIGVRVEAPPSPGVPSQPATQPLRQLCQAILDRLEQPQGTDQNTLPPTDLQAFLAALQATAQEAVQHGAHRAKAATAPVQPNAPPAGWLPLDQETRTHVTTAVMCRHLARKEQTARIWAMRQTGPLQAIRVHGRLMWPVASIRNLLLGVV